MLRISIVIPMRNEAGNVVAVLDEVASAMAEAPAWEVIVVDDGSSDGTAEELEQVRRRMPQLRVLTHRVSAGQSAAIHNGVLAARADVVCMLDGDGQNPPAELAKLWPPLVHDPSGRTGLVAGQRKHRRDTPSKRVASIAANAIRSRVLRDGTRDTGCGLKAFRRAAWLDLPYFDHMHRFLPALFRREGWEVVMVDVEDRPRLSGASNYTNIQRAFVGAVDLVGVAWLIRRRRKQAAVEQLPAAAAEAAE